MELAATVLGRRYAIADIVVGGLVLAVVTSLPNAVTAVYLARRGRGAAVLSTALNSNAINVMAGLLVPASVTGLGPRSGQNTLVAAWYAGMTLFSLALAYRDRGLGRVPGAAIIAGYLAFVTALVLAWPRGASARSRRCSRPLSSPRRAPCCWPGRTAGGGRNPCCPRWSISRLWRLSLVLSAAIVACDAASGATSHPDRRARSPPVPARC